MCKSFEIGKTFDHIVITFLSIIAYVHIDILQIIIVKSDKMKWEKYAFILTMLILIRYLVIVLSICCVMKLSDCFIRQDSSVFACYEVIIFVCIQVISILDIKYTDLTKKNIE